MDATIFTELTWQAWLTLGLVGIIFTVLVFTSLPSDFVFMGVLAVLLVTGVLDPHEALSGFASEGMVTVGMLYVVVAGLQATGGLGWITRHILGVPKTDFTARLRLMLPVAGISAFLNNTPVVAMFLPAVNQWAKNIKIRPSQVMIPLSYAAILGGICTLIGTSTNLVVNGLYQSRFGNNGIGMFEITKLGLPCAVVGILFVVFLGRKLLPNRGGAEQAFENPRQYTLELLVNKGSPLAGKTVEESGLDDFAGGLLAELIRGERIISVVRPKEILQENDRLIFVGVADAVKELRNVKGLTIADDQLFKLETPRHERCLVEAVVSNTCPLVGKTIGEGEFRSVYNAVVLAIARNGDRLTGKIADIKLRAGDTLLVESHAGFIPRQRDSRDFFLVSAIEDSVPVQAEKAPLALVILLLMVVFVAFNWLSMLNAALLAAAAMLATGCCSFGQARKSVEWNVLIVIAAALGLGRALDKTGAAETISTGMLSLAGNNPHVALTLVYIVAALFTEVITNNAVAALIFPVAMSTATRLGVNPMPFVICLMIAASSSFATPIGYQTNMMVYGPGGYRFSDYFKIGIPLTAVIGTITVVFAPLIWPF
jgi:di/tricarboxylate transporter